jgi:uncharacterized membrane protein
LIGLDDLPGGEHWSVGYAVSGDGSTVVGISESERSGWNGESFRWTPEEGMVGLGNFAGQKIYESSAWDVSGDGSVVVGVGTLGNRGGAYRWTEEDGMLRLGHLDGRERYRWAWGVSSDGAVVVGESISKRSEPWTEAFRWTQQDGMRALVEDFDQERYARGASDLSADGDTVVGVAASYAGFEAFRWTESDGMVGLGFLCDGSESWAFGVSRDGTTVVGKASCGHVEDYRIHAMRWTAEEGMISLGVLPGGRDSSARAVSADGSVIVGDSQSDRDFRQAFIWTREHGMRFLLDVLDREYGVDATGWILGPAYDISDDGRMITGDSSTPDRNPEAFLAYLGTIRLGDVNCDESIDFDDIDAFVLVLADPDDYRRAFPDCDAELADIDRDGFVDAADIDPFVCCLIRGSCYDCR